jgi:hypothetical protein
MVLNRDLGQLNPDWVESLMGFPVGWTDIAGLPEEERPSMRGNRRGSRNAKIGDDSE